MKIPVYLIKTGRTDYNIHRLRKLFSGCDDYEVNVVKHCKEKEQIEIVRDVLKNVQYNGAEVIIIFDYLLPHIGRHEMKKTIAKFLKVSGKYDLCYLFKYMDDCIKCRDEDVSNKDIYNLYKCFNPVGLDAVIYTQSGIKKMMDCKIKQENVKSACFSPCLFEYDYENYARNSKDYYKTVKCAPIQENAPEAQNIGTKTLIMLVLLVIIIVLVAYALIKTYPYK